MMFELGEEDWLLRGEEVDAWTSDELQKKIVFRHSYTDSCQHAVWLREIMFEMSAPDRRALLLWLTGSPRLPPGGLSALQAYLTVVKKRASSIESSSPGSSLSNQQRISKPEGDGDLKHDQADNDLPSSSSCACYLKLPPYSTKERMSNRLRFAIRHGGGFHLS